MSSETPRLSTKKIKSAHRISRRLVLAIGAGLIVLVLCTVLIKGFMQNKSPIDISSFDLQFARTAAEQTQGLSGRESLGKNEVLIFDFAQGGGQCFWMKDMKFAIDIVWLDKDLQVTHLVESALPESYPAEFCAKNAPRYVIEFRDRRAAQLGIAQGSVVKF